LQEEGFVESGSIGLGETHALGFKRRTQECGYAAAPMCGNKDSDCLAAEQAINRGQRATRGCSVIHHRSVEMRRDIRIAVEAAAIKVEGAV
jgi:hypothetical protein